jgi:methyl acetate hydrolase
MLLNRGMEPNGSLLMPATVDLMRQNHIGDLTILRQVGVDPGVSQPFPINAGVDNFGLGFQVAASQVSDPDLRAEGSYSWSGLQNTHFWVDPVRGIGAVILMQQLPFYDDQVMELVENFEVLVNRTLAD